MKTVDVTKCCVKEVAPHAQDSHWYIVQRKTPEFQCSVTFQHKAKITAGRKKLFTYMNALSLNLRGADSLLFLKNQPEFLKSSTMKGLKSSF